MNEEARDAIEGKRAEYADLPKADGSSSNDTGEGDVALAIRELENSKMIDDHMLNPRVTMVVEKVHEDAILPRRGTNGAAGYDLCSVENLTIEGWTRKPVRTGI